MSHYLIIVCLVAAMFVLHGAEAENQNNELGTVIGIDLGTTYSWLANLCIYIIFICITYTFNFQNLNFCYT